MRKRKRLLAVVLAAAMVCGLCLTATGESVVHAEENGQVEETANSTEPSLTAIRASVPDPVTLPFQFEMELELKNAEDMAIGQIDVVYRNSTTGSEKWFTKSFYQSNGNLWNPGKTNGITQIEIGMDDFANAGQYELETIYFWPDGNGAFRYDREGNELKGYNGDGTESGELYSYNGDADFVIPENPNADTKAPEIRAVSIITDPVSTGGKVEISVDYAEEGSGVKSVNADFAASDDIFNYFYSDSLEQGSCTGEGTITIQNAQHRTLGTEYNIRHMSIEDYAGNTTYYSLNDEGNSLVATDSMGQIIGSIPVISYKVTEETKTDWLEVTGIKIQEGIDRSQIAAGDSFDVIVSVKNSTEKEHVLNGWDFLVKWNTNVQAGFENGKEIPVAPGTEAEITIPVTISKYAEKGEYKLSSIGYRDGEYEVQYNIYNEQMNGSIYKDYSLVYEIPGGTYKGTADYTVTKADTPDTDAPYIQEVRVVDENIEAPGKVRVEIQAQYGNAEVKSVNLQFEDVEYPDNRIYMGGTRFSDNTAYAKDVLYYSDKRGCYILESELLDVTTRGNYKLIQAEVTDEAGSFRYYNVAEDGKLIDSDSGSTLDAAALTVQKSKRQDKDFDVPVLESIKVGSNEIRIPGQARYTIKAKDESGLSKVNLTYKTEDGTRIYVVSTDITKNGEEYICNVKFDKYLPTGNFTLDNIVLQDSSYGENVAYYSRKGDVLYSGQAGGEVAYSGEADVTLKRSQEDPAIISIFDTQIDSKLQALENGTTANIIGLDAGNQNSRISKETMKIVKEKKLKLRLVMSTYEGNQILLDGAALTDAMVQELHLIVAYQGKNMGVYFGNAQDSAGYGFYLEGDSGKIPMTIRLAVDSDFYQTYKNSNIRFSEYTYTKSGNKILSENLKMVEEDGVHFIEVPLKEGVQYADTEYAVSTDTTKYFDYAIDTEVWVPSSTNEVVKGKDFSYNFRIANENDETLKNITVYPEMQNAEDGTVIDFAGMYTISVAGTRSLRGQNSLLSTEDNVVINDDGSVLIKELKKGQAVELVAAVKIPETFDLERVVMRTHAAVTDESGQSEVPIAYGNVELTVTVREPVTIIKGDINGDGAVDAGDLMYMLQVVSERISEADLSAEQIKAADVAGADGKITADDLMKMLQFVSERISSLE